MADALNPTLQRVLGYQQQTVICEIEDGKHWKKPNTE